MSAIISFPIRIASAFTSLSLMASMFQWSWDGIRNSQYVRKQYTAPDEVTSVNVEEVNTAITIQSIEDDDVQVEYSNLTNKELYSISLEEGVLTIQKDKKFNADSVKSNEDHSLIISLPEREYEKLSVTAQNGSLSIGAVEFQDITAELTNGSVSFDGTNAVSNSCTVTNGNISGKLCGKQSEYAITTSLINGFSRLPSTASDGTSRTIHFSVTNGTIGVDFEG